MDMQPRTAHNKGKFKCDPQEAARLYREVGVVSEVARRLGVSRCSASRAVASTGTQVKPRTLALEIKAEAERLYSENEMSSPEVAQRLGICPSTVARHMSRQGKIRDSSTAHVLSAQKNKNRKGTAGWWQSEKTGKWESADSRFELARMAQLDSDPEVSTWTRHAPIIPYGSGRKYIPDFLIHYADGRQVLEEVKPKKHVQKEIINIGKKTAAEQYAKEHGMEYRITTEHEIGINYIRTYLHKGITEPEEAERMQREKEVDQQYRDENRARENARTLNWYHLNRDREIAKRNAKRQTQRQQVTV